MVWRNPHTVSDEQDLHFKACNERDRFAKAIKRGNLEYIYSPDTINLLELHADLGLTKQINFELLEVRVNEDREFQLKL